MHRLTFIVLLALPAVLFADGEPPTVADLHRAGYKAEDLRPLLESWLDAYPESATEWPDEDLDFVVALLVGAEMEHHEAAASVAEERVDSYLGRNPVEVDRAAQATSLAVRLRLRRGDHDDANRLLGLGRHLCGALGLEPLQAEATACAFLLRDAALLAMRLGEYDAAELDLERARTWLRPHPRSAASVPVLYGAGDLACWRGEIQSCAYLYGQGTRLASELEGADSEIAAYGYLGLGWAAALADDWGPARAAFDRAETIWVRELGSDHPRLADVLIEYGELLRRSGDSSEAVSVLQRAVRLRESRLGPSAFDLPRALDALGLAYLDLGDLRAAEAALQRSLAIRRRHLEASNVALTRSWSALALLQQASGHPAAASRLLSRSLELQRRELGENQPLMGVTSLRLANLLVETEPARAAALAASARSILGQAYGSDHPTVGFSWWIEARADQFAGIDPLASALKAEAIGRAHLRHISWGLSERDLLNYLSVRPQGADLALETLLRSEKRPVDPARVQSVWQEIARSRGLVFDTLNHRPRAHPLEGRACLQRFDL